MADTLIKDENLAREMADAEKLIRDKALSEAGAASEKVKRDYESATKIKEGFEGQFNVLTEKILSLGILPEEVAKSFESPKKIESKSGLNKYQIIGEMPYPNDQTKERQFPAKVLNDVLSKIDNLKISVHTLTDDGGQGFRAVSESNDYFSVKFSDFPSIAMNVGVINKNNISATRSLNRNSEATLSEILSREGSSIFKIDIVPVPTRQ